MKRVVWRKNEDIVWCEGRRWFHIANVKVAYDEDGQRVLWDHYILGLLQLRVKKVALRLAGNTTEILKCEAASSDRTINIRDRNIEISSIASASRIPYILVPRLPRSRSAACLTCCS